MFFTCCLDLLDDVNYQVHKLDTSFSRIDFILYLNNFVTLIVLDIIVDFILSFTSNCFDMITPSKLLIRFVFLIFL